MSADKALKRAHKLIGEAKHKAALEPLRSFWERKRSPAVAALLGALGRLGPIEHGPFSVGTRAANQSAWLMAARSIDATVVLPLLGALEKCHLMDAVSRLEVMLTWPPDPRVAETMISLVNSHSIGEGPRHFWKHVYALLVRNADPRYREFLAGRAPDFDEGPGVDRYRVERVQVRRTIGPYLDALSANVVDLTREETELVQEMSSRVEGLRSQLRPTALEESLLRAIVLAPEDDSVKRVYSDFLSELGDPRGEFIALELALADGKKVKGKLDAFERTHLDGILGPLSFAHSYVTDRGILRELELRYGDPPPEMEMRQVTTDLRWMTVATLELSGYAVVNEEILSAAPLIALKRLEHASGKVLAIASQRKFPWAIER